MFIKCVKSREQFAELRFLRKTVLQKNLPYKYFIKIYSNAAQLRPVREMPVAWAIGKTEA